MQACRHTATVISILICVIQQTAVYGLRGYTPMGATYPAAIRFDVVGSCGDGSNYIMWS